MPRALKRAPRPSLRSSEIFPRPRRPNPTNLACLFKFISEASAQDFTQLWSDPAAYFWVRRAVHFLAACNGASMGPVELAYCAEVGATDPHDALRIHLADFKRFALGLAILSGEEFNFPEPYVATLPLALPGTDLVVAGIERICIHGVTTSHLDVTYDGGRIALPITNDSASTPRVERCPCIEADGVRIPLNSALFRLPGIGLSREWTAPSSDFQRQGSQALGEAMSLVARIQPESVAQFRHALKVLALKPMREGTFSSLSSSELPGAFICSVPCDRYELAATLIHEFYHNRLYFIEEGGPFFEERGQDSVDGENHYSPWRDGLRPLHGIFHALYVYLPVFRFWSGLFRKGELNGIQLAYAKDQLARIPFQLRVGVNQLRRHAKFSSFGSMLFEQMAAETAFAQEQSRALEISLDLPAISLRSTGILLPMRGEVDGPELTIGETLRAHLEKSDRRLECAEEKALLDRVIASDSSAR